MDNSSPLNLKKACAEGFTLIELLVVIAVIAILAVVVVLVINPAELLKQSRDAQRLSDMATIASAINLYNTDQSGVSTYSLGNASNTAISIYDPNGSSTCGSLGLPSLTISTGQAWQCSTATSSRNVNGSGWIPVTLTNISAGSPVGSLPVDPVNQTSTGLFYAYNTNSTQFQATANFESQKYKTLYGNSAQTNYFPEVISAGTPGISALYNPTGLVGYWSFDEGSGSSTIDGSGNGNNGTWSGAQQGTNGYYSGGKVGGWAGTFDVAGPTSTQLQVANNTSLDPTAAITTSAWIYLTTAYALGGDGYNSFLDKGDVGGYMMRLNQNLGIDMWLTPKRINFLGAFTLNTWTLMTTTYDGAVMIVYKNGIVLTSSSASGSLTPGTNPLYIGYRNGSTEIFPGLLDDVRIYNRALSPAEIMALYNAEK